MGAITQGRNRAGISIPDFYGSAEPGDYLAATIKVDGEPERRLFVCLPDGSHGSIHHGPDGWTIDEHEDGTVTAHPSIHDEGGWHGWLERGVWRSC